MSDQNEHRSLDPKMANNIVLISMLSLLVMIMVVLGGMFYFRRWINAGLPGTQGEHLQTYQSYYVLITDQRKTPFWESVYEGAVSAAEKSGVYVELLGADLDEEYDKEQLMEIAIASKVDGIIVEADDSNKMTQLIREADNAGIPVVTALGDNALGGRKSFAGVSSYNLGKEYGKQVCEIYKKKSYETMTALVLLDADETNTNQNTILTAIREMIESEQLSGNIQLETSLIDKQSAFSSEESIRDIFLQEEESLPEVIVCLDEQDTTCVYQAVVDHNKVGEVEILGYYESDTIRSAIEKNIIAATITVDTQQMGELCVEALNEYREMGYVSDYFAVDTQLIDASSQHVLQEGGADEKAE